MWILIVLSMTTGFMDPAGKGSLDDCTKIAKSGLQYHGEWVKKAWCMPEAEWKEGTTPADKYEIHL